MDKMEMERGQYTDTELKERVIGSDRQRQRETEKMREGERNRKGEKEGERVSIETYIYASLKLLLT